MIEEATANRRDEQHTERTGDSEQAHRSASSSGWCLLSQERLCRNDDK
jgi:hypothetical protein